MEKSISFIRQDLDFFTRAKARALLDLATEQLGGTKTLKALDVGCGPGETDEWLVDGSTTCTASTSRKEFSSAARERNPGVDYVLYDGERLPFDDSMFDLVFAINVIHHVPTQRWEPFIAELTRVVRPGGLLALIEHNPLNPLTRLAVARCEFDDDVVLLPRREAERLQRDAGLQPIASRYITFFPVAKSMRSQVSSVGSGVVPLGAQYLAAGRRSG